MSRYSEIADELRRRIEGHEYKVGEKLPAISALQVEFDVPGQNTVRQALQLLAAGGYVKSQQGRGTYVTSNKRAINSIDVRAELRAARAAIDRALAALKDEAGEVRRDAGAVKD